MGNKEKKNKHLLLGGVGEGRGRTDPGHPGHNALPSCPTTRPGPRPNSSRTTKSGGANGARLPGTVRLSASGVGALGPTGEHAELGSAGGRPTRASSGPREPAPGPGPGEDPRVYLGSAPPSRRFPGPARGVRAQAAPLPSRARREPRGPDRWSSGAAPLRGASLAGRRLPSRVPAPRGTAAEPSATREEPPEDGRTDGRKAGGRAHARAPPPEPLRYRSGDDEQGRVVAANLSEGH